jgi:hypothetical protein
MRLDSRHGLLYIDMPFMALEYRSLRSKKDEKNIPTEQA